MHKTSATAMLKDTYIYLRSIAGDIVDSLCQHQGTEFSSAQMSNITGDDQLLGEGEYFHPTQRPSQQP